MKKEKIKMPDLHNVREKGENQISRTMEKARSFKIGKSGFYLKFRNVGFSINPETGYGTDMIPGYPLCTGPPGRARSPGDRGHPEHPPDFDQISKVPGSDIPEHSEFVSEMNKDPVRNKDKIGNQKSDDHTVWFIRKRLDEFMKNRINTEYQIINRYKLNFLQTLISRIMKKQILFLAMFTLAMILAGTSTVFGQLAASTNPITPLSCVTSAADPLHPYAGVPYVYSLTGDAGEEHAKNYSWWATKDNNFVTAAGTTSMSTAALASPDVTSVSSTYGVTTPAATANSNQVTITWSADILSRTTYQGAAGEPTFVVGYAEGENCADNIQVYEINPLPNFTVDIAPIDPATSLALLYGDDATAKECVDVVQSATYDNSTHELTMDYGTNTIYFEVAAANFVIDWTPTFTLVSGLNTSQTAVLELYPTLADAQAGTNIIGTPSTAWDNTGGTWATGSHLTAADPLDAYSGVSAFVKVVITNSNEESLTSNPFVLAVDAQDNTETGIWDMEDDDCTALADAADQIDQATITITPRPQLDNNTADTNATAPNDRVIKTNP